MKTLISSMILCAFLGGCGTHRYEYFTTPFVLPTDEVQAIPHLIPTEHDGFGVPLLYWHSTRGAPYRLELKFFSKTKPTDPIILTKVVLLNTEGETHQLLSEQREIKYFYPRQHYASHTKHGKYSGEVYEATWVTSKPPLKFIKGKCCTITVEFTVAGESNIKSWEIRANLEKGSENIVSYMRNY